MIPLYTEYEFLLSKSSGTLPIMCEWCKNTFYITKNQIKKALNPNALYKGRFCSLSCANKKQGQSTQVQCKNCGIKFLKQPAQIKKHPNHFCSQSCAATYNNLHKKSNPNREFRRSKLEKWLEGQLLAAFPDMQIHFNRKDIIDSELDIYIPNLKLAFEINGIYHYRPIHGQKKFEKILKNDHHKIQSCIKRNIELHIINSSNLGYFKPSKAQRYFDLIYDIIIRKIRHSATLP